MGKSAKRKAQTTLKEGPTRNRRAKKTRVNPVDEINMLNTDELTKDIFARLGNNKNNCIGELIYI